MLSVALIPRSSSAAFIFSSSPSRKPSIEDNAFFFTDALRDLEAVGDGGGGGGGGEGGGGGGGEGSGGGGGGWDDCGGGFDRRCGGCEGRDGGGGCEGGGGGGGFDRCDCEGAMILPLGIYHIYIL